ncbi:MAG: sulfatase-like hydrolase/transferase, partial [Pseudonocardiaceae bacterium]
NPIPVRGVQDATATENLEHYARGLRHSDNAMRHFVRTLKATEEETLVVFYGDHLPPVWPPSTLSARARHETPFFVHANFDLPKAERLPTTSPIYFMNHVLRSTDAVVPPYYALLQRLEQQVPAMGQTAMIGPDDQRLSKDRLPARARHLLRDYRLVQYDLSIGRRYAEDGMFDATPGRPGGH